MNLRQIVAGVLILCAASLASAESFRAVMRQARRGDADAQAQLGYRYYKGEGGVRATPSEIVCASRSALSTIPDTSPSSH